MNLTKGILILCYVCTPNSNYYTLSKLNQLLDNLRHDSISLFLFNIRSMPKNVAIVNDFLYTLNNSPDILAITETKLNNNNVINVNLANYNLFHTDSPTIAGGAGLYISKVLQYIYSLDLKFSIPLVESCWSEIISGKNKPSVVVGWIYRHSSPNLQEFTSELESIIKQLNKKKHEVFILGDMNIDYLKYNEHSNTEEYLDMLYLNNFLLLITEPTRVTDRSSTLIDHVYSNTPIQNIVSGIALIDISDNLPHLVN